MTAVKMELPNLPVGYSYTGEYRPPKKGEYFVDSVSNTLEQAHQDYSWSLKPIVEKRHWEPEEDEEVFFVAYSGGVGRMCLPVENIEQMLEDGYYNFFQTEEKAREAAELFSKVLEGLRDGSSVNVVFEDII